jgi:hypothetical protein
MHKTINLPSVGEAEARPLRETCKDPKSSKHIGQYDKKKLL